jgi:hypothetical protein
MRVARPSSDDGIADFDSRARSTHGIILMHLRNAEDGHRRIADELLDPSAVALEYLADARVIARHDLAQHLRIAALAERRRAHEVAEEDGNRFANVSRHASSVSLVRLQKDANLGGQ